MQRRRILITAVKWSKDKEKILEESLAAAYKKYNGKMLVMVGYTAPGLKIASIAIDGGFSVQMFAPDIKVITGEHIETVNGITVTSSSQGEYLKHLVGSADAIMAFDKGDPVVLTASHLKKTVWFPDN